MNVVFLNGQFVSAEKASVPVFDRGFLYGDGVFETMRVYDGTPILWNEHLDRLQYGVMLLRIKLPFSATKLKKAASTLLQQNKTKDAVLRLQISRGSGVRGYSPSGANAPTVLITLHPLPSATVNARVRLVTSSLRVPPADPLALVKSCNKLRQVIARAEADEAGVEDALFLNTRNEIAETTSANLFWIKSGVVYTAPEDSGILPGITRQTVMRLCKQLKLRCVEKRARREVLFFADGAFLTSSVMELVEVAKLDNRAIGRSPITIRLADAYHELVRRSLF